MTKRKTTRRGKGEGNIRERADGRWEARVNLGWKNGKRQRKSVYGATRPEVAAELNRLLHDQQEGLPIPTGQLTVKDFFTAWLENSARPNLRASTYARYESLVRLYIIPDLGRIQLKQLAPADLQGVLVGMVKQGKGKNGKNGLSQGSLKYCRAVVSAALNQALRWGYVSRNIAALVDIPRARPPKQYTTLTEEELRALLVAVHGERMEAFYVVALALGMRRGEVLGLKWSDIDFTAGLLVVRRSLQWVDHKLVFDEPKTRHGLRTIYLPDTVRQALQDHRRRQLKEREQAMKRGYKWEDHDLVFSTRRGTPTNPHNMRRHFLDMLERAGIPPVRIHDMRHTMATLMRDEDVPIEDLSKMLGHSDVRFTLSTYVHPGEKGGREVAKRMENVLKRPKKKGSEAS